MNCSDQKVFIENLDDGKEDQTHIFHETCISEWFGKKFECPLCRTSFKKAFVDYLKMLKAQIVADRARELESGGQTKQNSRNKSAPSGEFHTLGSISRSSNVAPDRSSINF